MQKAIVHNVQLQFHDELNRLLSSGYRVVPGTMYATTMPMMPNKKTPPEQIDPAGFHHRPFFFVVVEPV